MNFVHKDNKKTTFIKKNCVHKQKDIHLSMEIFLLSELPSFIKGELPPFINGDLFVYEHSSSL
jgi:hypothetical protein